MRGLDAEEAQLSRISETSARLVPHVGALVATVALLIGISPPAHAQPDVGSDPAIGTTTLSLADAGLENGLQFFGDTGQTTLTFPVPSGLRPTALNTTLNLPFGIRSGTVTVTQDDRLISKVGLPPVDFEPVVIPLDAVVVTDDVVNLTLRLTALAEDRYCLDADHPVILTNGSITFTGSVSNPTTVADFLPPVLRTLTIGVPERPSQAESGTALQLAAALLLRYRSQAPQVALVPLPGDAAVIDGPAQPFERRIVVKEGGEEGLSLSGGPDPQLRISGPPDRLPDQARLLTDGNLTMAVGTNVVTGTLRTRPPPAGESTTLADLGEPGLSSTGVAPKVGIALDQTRFGRAIGGYRLHLTGSHTPLPADVGGRVTASVDGQIIDSWPITADGTIDHWVDLPDDLVERYTNIVVGIDTSGDMGDCDDYRPITLTIYGSTVVQNTPAEPPLAAGFNALPQALMPYTKVGIAADSFVDTQRALQIVLGLQRLSVVPLLTEVVSVQQAIEGDEPAIVVSPEGWTDTSITLPVSSENQWLTLTGLGDEEETTLALEPGIRFGSLQTVSDGNRSLLIATSNGAPAELDRLLRWLNDDPRGWSRLRGNAVLAIEGAEPQLVPGRSPLAVLDAPAVTSEAEADRGGETPTWWIAGGVIAAVVIGISAYWLGTRRRPGGDTTES